nr:acyltransferase family protein [uncultured Dongia sp.]
MKYRPDIDGLRAIAVLSVVIYHLHVYQFGMNILPGGFVGVDIFFVISGYLITKLIHGEMVEGRYSIVEFYSRRARRIFPALFFMSAVCAVVILIFCLPSVVENFRSSLIASTLFVSNIYFYATADYFAPGAEMQPLLHTWSLAVEEQFYIFFPLVLLLIRRYSALTQTKVIVGIALVSLAISAWLVWSNAAASFYLLHSRAWELMIGSCLAMGTVPVIRNAKLAEVCSALGMLLIAGSVMFYSASMPFPGPSALLPCLGAALIIHAGVHARSMVGQLLSLPPVRFIGLISYSLYLWHWPINVLMRLIGYWYAWDVDTQPFKIVALMLGFVTATLSWYFVERPFRHAAVFRVSNRVTLAMSGAIMAVLVISGAMLTVASKELWQLPPEVERIVSVTPTTTGRARDFKSCFISPRSGRDDLFDADTCLRMSASQQNYIVIGDSHANDLVNGLKKVNPEINFLQATAAGCKPVLDQPGQRLCRNLMEMMFFKFLPSAKVDGIIISARWKRDDLPYLKETMRLLSTYAPRVIVVGPHVEYKHDLPSLMALSVLQDDPSLLDKSRKTGQRDIDTLYQRELAEMGVPYFSLYDAICTAGNCRTVSGDGIPLSFDYGHLTESGGIYVAHKMREWGMRERGGL